MADQSKHDAWNAGDNYEIYMGRWSREIARHYLDWLDAAPGLTWADIGCGTGALTETILDVCDPVGVIGVEPSEEFVRHAQSMIGDKRAVFHVAGAEALPIENDEVDIIASGLVINFVPDPQKALREMSRITRSGGTLSFYVWDYPGGGMGFIDTFWKAAAEADPAASELDEGKRFPFCTPEGLLDLCRQSGWLDPTIEPVEINTVFADFDEFLHPFTLGAGPAPGYYKSLSEEKCEQLCEALKMQLGDQNPIELVARAWAVRAKKD